LKIPKHISIDLKHVKND